MSLTGSLYAGISGMYASSQQMSVIGNNLANTSTTGFKGSSMQFEDIFYRTLGTSGGTGQIGVGVGVSSITSNFTQGSFESTGTATNVAIGGDGFFVVRNKDTGANYYTRAGNFDFDSSGYLVNPSGLRVQGWKVESGTSGDNLKTTGSARDIRLDNFQSPPKATQAVSMAVNLDSDSEDNSASTANPFFSMLEMWDGTADEPLSSDRYAYQGSIKVYDENGTANDLTVYFDPVDDATVTSNAGGNRVWEYVVTVPPSSDGRTIDGQALKSSSSAGVLMVGTLTFNSSGEIIGQSAYTLKSTASGDLKDLSNWTAAELNKDGLPVFTANFSSETGASATDQTGARELALDFGFSAKGTAPAWSGTAVSADLAGNDPANLISFSASTRDALCTTNYDTGSTTISQDQDGYSAGFLKSVAVSDEGVVTGRYTNGQVLDLYVLTLANFNNASALHQEGGNLYTATRDSGEALTGLPNTGTLGTISSATLEMSNVDMSTEMVRLITAQRMYQANSKIITTADQLLGEALNLKR